MRIAIVPAGAWGTALAATAAAGGHRVRLWRRQAAARPPVGHPALPGLQLPENADLASTVAEAADGADLVVVSPSSDGLREVCRLLRPHLSPHAVLLSVAKGLEPGTLLRMSEVIAAEIPEAAGRVAALSGPNFALEVARGIPTGTVIAAADSRVAEFAQDLLMSRWFRVYTNPDVVGVELGGALKNVVALGVGIGIGLGMGHNTTALLITRGLSEIARLGKAMGGHNRTFAGLSGLGDLVLTCTGELSRNRKAGIALGRGAALAEAVGGATVEGVRTTQAAWQLAERHQVEMPVTEQLYRVLFEGVDAPLALQALMTRQKKGELLQEEVALPVPRGRRRRGTVT
jgi:glycerol-3-phosphate dehydrogenase (NAD(P)+)